MSSGENDAVQENDSRKELKDEFRVRLNEVQGKDAKKCVMNYYGERGGGKSWFVGDLRREAREKGYTVLELDFSSGRMEPEDALERLMRDLEEKKINFKECGEGMRKLGRSWDVKLPRRKAAIVFLLAIVVAVGIGSSFEYAINRVRFIQTEASPDVVKFLVKLLSSVANVLIGAFGFTVIKPWAREKVLKGEQKKIQRKLRDEYKDLDFKEKENLRECLPEWFAKDVNKWHESREWRNVWLNKWIEWHNKRFAKDANERRVNREHRNVWHNKWIERLNKRFEKWAHDETLCIFIDAYDSRKNDDRWLYGEHGLCRHLDHAIFAITGKEKLPWKNGDENRDKFWREEGSEGKPVADGKPHGELIYREIKKPDEKESRDKYKSVSESLWNILYERTDGWPELLDKWCKVFASGDKSNDLSEVSAEQREKQAQLPEEQSEKLAEWVKAFVEDHWHVKVSESVYLMAGMRRWTKELLECAMWASGAGINDDIEDVIKELGVEGLITRESGGVYSMCNDSIRDILVRNTILDQSQRERAYWALIRENTASGAEAAYYLGEKDLWEEKLAKQLEYHARCLAAKPEKKQEQEPDGAGNNDYWKEFEEEMQSEQQQEKQQALYKRIVDLREKAINVFDKVGNVKEENVCSRLFAMNNRSMYCRFLDRYDEAFALAEQVLEECEVLEKSKGWHWLEKTKKLAQKNKDAAQKKKEDAGAESGEP